MAGNRPPTVRPGKCTGELILVLLLLTLPALAEPISPDRMSVRDGDTIRKDRKRPDIRLLGYNAPETRRAKCPVERISAGWAPPDCARWFMLAAWV